MIKYTLHVIASEPEQDNGDTIQVDSCLLLIHTNDFQCDYFPNITNIPYDRVRVAGQNKAWDLIQKDMLRAIQNVNVQQFPKTFLFTKTVPTCISLYKITGKFKHNVNKCINSIYRMPANIPMVQFARKSIL